MSIKRRSRICDLQIEPLKYFVLIALANVLCGLSGAQLGLHAQSLDPAIFVSSHGRQQPPLLTSDRATPSARTSIAEGPATLSANLSEDTEFLHSGPGHTRFIASYTGCCSSSIQSTLFGLTVKGSSVTAALTYGTSRSWDTWPHPSWSDSNPSPGVYNFVSLDAYIAANQGRDMIYTLGRTPQWASSQPSASTDYGPGQCAPPTNISDWDNYVTAVATHAAGSIKYWELWNEPQNKKYYCGDIPTMVLLAQHAQRIIKGINPSAVILSPAPTGGNGPAWLSSFLSQGGAATVDAIAFHGYADQVAEDVIPIIQSYKAVMTGNGLANLPMWDTEENGGAFPTPDAGAAYLSKIYLLHASQGVSRLLWYAYDAPDPAQGQLWNPVTGVLSSAATAYAQTQNWLVGASLVTPCAMATNNVWTCGFSRSNYQAQALWNSSATTTITVPAQFIQYRDLLGNIHPITNGTVSVGNSPILVETAATTTDALTFAAIAPQAFEGAPFPVFATSASNGAVTYSVISGPATISGSLVTLTGAGTVVLGATQAANANFVAGTATTSFYAAPGPPTVSFAPIPTQTFGGAPVQLGVISNSAGAVTYSVSSGPATVSGSTVTFTGAGTVFLNATLAASGNYTAATATTSFNVVAGTPVLSFAPIAPQVYGTRFPISATSASTGQVFYSVVSGPATISGYTVAPTGVGTVVLSATQRSTANFTTATATTTATIGPAVPTLNFAPIAAQTLGGAPFTVKASSVSGGTVTYSVVSGPATIAGATVTPNAVGTVVLSAALAASGNYSAATATTSFTVAPGACTLSFAAIAPQTFGTRFSVAATSVSTGQVFYSVASGPATVSGNMVTPTAIGTVVLSASQRASGNCAAATATANVTIAPMVPPLSFTPIALQTLGNGPFAVAAQSVSSGPITYTVVSGPATIAGAMVTPTAVGTVTLSATQAASGNYASASALTSFPVSAGSCSLTFAAIGPQTFGTRFPVSASSASTGQVSYSVITGPATVSGYLVTPTGAGTVTLGASQRATSTCAASTATTTATIAPMVPTLAFAPIAPQTYGGAPISVSAASVSSGAVTYSVVSGPATLSGSTVTLTGAGTVLLSASQAANGNYATASATAKFTALRAVPTLTFAPIGTQTSGIRFSVNATSVSSGQVFYSVVSGPATVSGYTVTPTGTGTVVLSASQRASGNYAAATASASVVINPASSAATPSATAAARLLDQSSFGPTLASIAQVQSLGIQGYLDQQFATPASVLPAASATASPSTCAGKPTACLEGAWWNAAISGPDQLRQRVAFALSEIFDISAGSSDATVVPQLHNALAQDAFSNYATLMKDVATSPAMGEYRSLLANPSASLTADVGPDLARADLFLSSIGNNLLNPDATVQTDRGGNPIPAYTPEQAQAFAKAYTGLTSANAAQGVSTRFANANVFMASAESGHETSAKILLNHAMLPAGQTATEDLEGAIANLFNHPNTGPFVSQQLIQRLVTSTPSPAYIARVASVFANNGAGVRGDMQAIIQAILTDDEARAGDTNQSLDRNTVAEPVIFVSAVTRGLGVAASATDVPGRTLSAATSTPIRYPFTTPSVFSLSPSDYLLSPATLVSSNSATQPSSVLRQTLAGKLLGSASAVLDLDRSADTSLKSLAAAPTSLVDTLSTLFLHDQMSPAMRGEIIAAITPLPTSAQRLQLAVYLIVTSPQYSATH